MIQKPLLAHTVPTQDDPDALRNLEYPLMWSPKLDGIRTLFIPDRGGAVSRTFKRFPNEKMHTALSRPEFAGFDGETIYGPIFDKDVFNRTQSAVMKVAGPGLLEADGKVLVFDDFTHPDDPYEDRYARLEERVGKLDEDFQRFIQLVVHRIATNDLELSAAEVMCVEMDAEGLMKRSMRGKYKQGRSTLRDGILGKVKRFSDTEATIVGVEEMMHNDNEAAQDNFGRTKRSSNQENLRPAGTLGALIVESPEFTNTFKIGTGFDAAKKAELWELRHELIGATVTFKYQASGMKDVPRFPVFKDVRLAE